MRSFEYAPVAADDTPFNFGKGYPNLRKRVTNPYALALSLTTGLFALISVVLAHKLHSLKTIPNTYESGFKTDLASVQTAIKVKETIFTGGLKYDENDMLYREIAQHQAQFVGRPGPDIDAAWDNLLAPLGMVLKDEEAGTIKGTTFREADGSWLLTLDLYHSLHCVNMVRQALDVDYYQQGDEDQEVKRIHTDHCLDYLRQAVQCAGDLTPLTYQYSESRGRRYPVFGAQHTCRDLGKIHEWAMQRIGNHTL